MGFLLVYHPTMSLSSCTVPHHGDEKFTFHGAINNCIAKATRKWNRVPKGAFERLELLDAKVFRAVLRGGGGGNTVFLPNG